MTVCKHCGHLIQLIDGVWEHKFRNWDWSVKFSRICKRWVIGFKGCGCNNPEPKE